MGAHQSWLTFTSVTSKFYSYIRYWIICHSSFSYMHDRLWLIKFLLSHRTEFIVWNINRLMLRRIHKKYCNLKKQKKLTHSDLIYWLQNDLISIDLLGVKRHWHDLTLSFEFCYGSENRSPILLWYRIDIIVYVYCIPKTIASDADDFIFFEHMSFICVPSYLTHGFHFELIINVLLCPWTQWSQSRHHMWVPSLSISYRAPWSFIRFFDHHLLNVSSIRRSITFISRIPAFTFSSIGISFLIDNERTHHRSPDRDFFREALFISF